VITKKILSAVNIKI